MQNFIVEKLSISKMCNKHFPSHCHNSTDCNENGYVNKFKSLKSVLPAGGGGGGGGGILGKSFLGHSKPVCSVYCKPVRPVSHSNSACPIIYSKPIRPVNHCKPIRPISHSKPVRPVNHRKPVHPVSLSKPIYTSC